MDEHNAPVDRDVGDSMERTKGARHRAVLRVVW